MEEYGDDATAAAITIQSIARGGKSRDQVREMLQGQVAQNCTASPDSETETAEMHQQDPATHPDAIHAQADTTQAPAQGGGDDFVKPTPPTSRPASSRPTSSSLRRPGGSKPGSRVASPLPGAATSRPTSAATSGAVA